jgi:Leucine-rich repeat (LRR) protein
MNSHVGKRLIVENDIEEIQRPPAEEILRPSGGVISFASKTDSELTLQTDVQDINELRHLTMVDTDYRGMRDLAQRLQFAKNLETLTVRNCKINHIDIDALPKKLLTIDLAGSVLPRPLQQRLQDEFGKGNVTITPWRDQVNGYRRSLDAWTHSLTGPTENRLRARHDIIDFVCGREGTELNLRDFNLRNLDDDFPAMVAGGNPTKIDLSGNDFRNGEKDLRLADFANMENLTSLNLSNNSLFQVPANVHLPRIEELDFHNNPELGNDGLPDWIWQSPTIKKLDVRNTGLRTIPTNVNLPHIEELDIRDNPLENFPDKIGPFTGLREQHLPPEQHLDLLRKESAGNGQAFLDAVRASSPVRQRELLQRSTDLHKWLAVDTSTEETAERPPTEEVKKKRRFGLLQKKPREGSTPLAETSGDQSTNAPGAASEQNDASIRDLEYFRSTVGDPLLAAAAQNRISAVEHAFEGRVQEQLGSYNGAERQVIAAGIRDASRGNNRTLRLQFGSSRVPEPPASLQTLSPHLPHISAINLSGNDLSAWNDFRFFDNLSAMPGIQDVHLEQCGLRTFPKIRGVSDSLLVDETSPTRRYRSPIRFHLAGNPISLHEQAKIRVAYGDAATFSFSQGAELNDCIMAEFEADAKERNVPAEDFRNAKRRVRDFLEPASPSEGKKILDLSRLSLRNMPPYVLGAIADAGRNDLETLNLNGCDLAEPLDLSAFEHTRLRELLLRDNPLPTGIAGLEKVPTLTEINLSQTTAPVSAADRNVDVAPYAQAAGLQRLLLRNNGITNITGLDAFQGHASLRQMDLGGNPLQDIPDHLFSLPPHCEANVGSKALSPVAKMELSIANSLHPDNTVSLDTETSSVLRTHETLGPAERYKDAVEAQLTAIEGENPDTARRLRRRIDPQIQTQTQGEHVRAINALFDQWTNPDHPESNDPQLAAMGRYRQNTQKTARSLLHGSIALQSVPERPNVQDATGWDALSRIAHYTGLVAAKGTSLIPVVGKFISAPLDAGNVLLGAYSSYKFNNINRAISQVLEQDEIEPFCDAFARGAALMTARTLPDQRSRLQRYFVDAPAYRMAQLGGTAAADKQETVEEAVASGHAAKAVMDLAFGKSLGVAEEDAARTLRSMTTQQKAEAALQHLCKEKGVPYKPHLFAYHPSLNEQRGEDVRGLTGAVLDIAQAGVRQTQNLDDRIHTLEKEIAQRDTVIAAQGGEIREERGKRWKLKDVVRSLGGKLEYSPGEEEALGASALPKTSDGRTQTIPDDSSMSVPHDKGESSTRASRI